VTRDKLQETIYMQIAESRLLIFNRSKK